MWKVPRVEIIEYEGRDHQVVNEHDHGWIEAHPWTGMANSGIDVRYGFADRDGKVAWFVSIDEEDPLVADDGPWRDAVEERLEWLGFEILEDCPDWHYMRE